MSKPVTRPQLIASRRAESDLPHAEPKHLPDEIARKLADAIQSGEFAVGDRLPSERQLGEQFSVSRAVVREALSQLKSEGLVEPKMGSGVYVIERNQRQAFRIQDVATDERDSIAMVMELLITFEMAAAKYAAKRRTPEDIKQMRRALIGMEYEIANDRLGDTEDFAFHQAIVQATHNPHFRALSEHLEHGARNVIRQARTNTRTQHGDLVEAVQQEHKAIYDAIVAGDLDGAARAAETHLLNAAERLNIYSKANGTKGLPGGRRDEALV